MTLAPGATLAPQPIVIDGTTFFPTATAPGAAPTAFVIAGQTLAPSHPITLGSGSDTTVVALTTNAAGSTVVVVGGSTSVLPPPTPITGSGQSTIAMGDIIMSALGGALASSMEESGSITEAVFTIPASGTRAAETFTAIEISSGVFVIPGVSGQPAHTITAGGADVTMDGAQVSAVATGVVIEENGTKTTVGVSTEAVETGSGGQASGTGAVQFTGGASTRVRLRSWLEILAWILTIGTIALL